MFWRARATIDEDDELWQFETWNWLLDNLGGIDALKSISLSFPAKTHFPPSELSGHAHALYVFDQVAQRFGIDADGFDIVCQDASVNPVLAPLAIVNNAPVQPLGTYSAPKGNRHVVSYSPDLLDNLENLIATFSHEICHPILFSIKDEPPGGPDNEEFATDLATIFYGFGVFGANTSFVFNQFTNNATGTQGWSVSRAGYLTPNEWGFGLAIRTLLAGDDENLIAKFLSSSVIPHFEKNLAYLRNNPDRLKDLRQE